MKFKMKWIANLLFITVLLMTPKLVVAEEYSIDEALEFAVKHNYSARSAEQDVFKANKQVWETTAIGLPQISGSVAYNNNIQPASSAIVMNGQPVVLEFGVPQDLTANVSLNQLVFDGSYIVGLQSAKVYRTISELAEEKTEVLVKEAVYNAYLAVLINDEAMLTTEKNIASIEKSIFDISEMYKNGFAEEQDVQQLELNLGSLKNQLNRSKRLAVVNREMLKYAMGLGIEQPITLSDNLESLLTKSFEEISLDQAMNLEGHIDYKISDNNLAANRLLIRYEKTKYLPNLSVFFNAGYSAFTQNKQLFNFKDEKWYGMVMAGAQLNIPIFSSLQRKTKVDMARIDLKKAEIEHQQLVQKLFTDLHSAQNAYAFAIDNYKSNKQSVALAEQIEEKESLKYKEGISTSMDLTNAQNQLYGSQQNYMSAIMQVVQAKVALDKALNKL